MSGRRQYAAPAYLFACLVLGGSSQTAWFNALLQLGAVAILAWAALAGPTEPLPKMARQLGWLAAAMVALVLLHLVPLPPAMWTILPGRGPVREGLAVLGLAPGWQSLSLAPYDTIAAALPLLPPLALLAAILVLRAYTRSGIAIALMLGATLGLALGVLQVGSAHSAEPRFYLQPEIDAGTPSGFFANPNHMATLLLITLPFLAAYLGSRRQAGPMSPRHHGGLLVGTVGVVLVVIGIVRNYSLAGLGLLVPVLIASGWMLVPDRPRARQIALGLAGVAAAALLLFLASPLSRPLFAAEANSSVSTRQDFLTTSLAVARDYAPVGAGLGTFQRVYRIGEDQRTADLTLYVNHAHDDYLELLVEAGVPGLLLVLLFLGWWARAVADMLRTPAADLYARAGAIASGAVLLHSLVDYPLRTSAISGSFAVCLGLMLVSRRSARSPTDLRPTRHLEIG